MFTTQLAGATPIMKRYGLFLLWQVRRLVNRWVAEAIADRVDQLRSIRPRAANLALSIRQVNTARADFAPIIRRRPHDLNGRAKLRS